MNCKNMTGVVVASMSHLDIRDSISGSRSTRCPFCHEHMVPFSQLYKYITSFDCHPTERVIVYLE